MRLAVNECLLRVPLAERCSAARDLGAEGIELCFGPYGFEEHLLAQSEAVRELRVRATEAGIVLSSVYAGTFHEHPLSLVEASARRRAAEVLARLLDACREAAVGIVVLPLLGRGEPEDEAAEDRLLDALPKAAGSAVTLALETAWPVDRLQKLLTRARNPLLRLAYDCGTATLLGQDPVADLRLLGDAVCQVRLRDCTGEGKRAPLGQGKVALTPLLRELEARRFEGWIVLESSPAADGCTSVGADLRVLRQAITPHHFPDKVE